MPCDAHHFCSWAEVSWPIDHTRGKWDETSRERGFDTWYVEPDKPFASHTACIRSRQFNRYHLEKHEPVHRRWFVGTISMGISYFKGKSDTYRGDMSPETYIR
jgi:hypothetical protein